MLQHRMGTTRSRSTKVKISSMAAAATNSILTKVGAAKKVPVAANTPTNGEEVASTRAEEERATRAAVLKISSKITPKIQTALTN